MKRTYVALLMMLALGGMVELARAKIAMGSQAYVVSGLDGWFYAKSTPKDETIGGSGSAEGTTQIYRVRKGQDELVDTYDWYAPRLYQPGVVMGWSPTAGKVAVMRTHDEKAAMADDRVELSFYLGGKFLRSYSVKDLVALGAKRADGLMRTSAPQRREAVEYKVLGCEQVPNTNDYRFVVEVGEGATVRFDILTGEVVGEGK